MDTERPKSHTGDYNIKRRLGKGFRNSKKSMMIFTTHKKEELNDNNYDENPNTTPARSCSLNALHTGQILLQPRMAQLETLEAKMARIENSLSTTPRKKKISSSNNSLSSSLIANATANLSSINGQDSALNLDSKSNSSKSTPAFSKISPFAAATNLIYKTSRDIAKEMESLKCALKDKDHVIDSLKGQLNTSLNFSRLSTSYLQSKQKQDHSYGNKQNAEERLQTLKQDMENKSLMIKNIKTELERLHVTDNIDVRIQQAELEYQLGREELNLLSVLEQIQSLKIYLEGCENANQQNDTAALFYYIQNRNSVTLHATEIVYDPKSPRFGVTISNDGYGINIEWSTEDSDLIKGDRLIEINGKIMFSIKNRDDVIRLLSISPNPAQMVVLRESAKTEPPYPTIATLRDELNAYRQKVGEAERLRDSFRSDNVRLKHRISYLEEQVAELLDKVSKNDIPSAKHSTEYSREQQPEPQIQIFQKGPKVTLIGNLRSNKSNLKIRDSLPTVHSSKLRAKNTCKSLDVLLPNEEPPAVNNDYRTAITESTNLKQYRAETTYCKKSADVIASRSAKCTSPEESVNSSRNRSSYFTNCSSTPTTATNYNSKNKENYYNLMNAERRIKYIKEAQNSLLGCGYELVGERNRKFKDDRSYKSADFDSEPNYHQSLKHISNGRLKMYDSETSSDYVKTYKYCRPIPPQKPLRLSLHKGCSLQSVQIIDKSVDVGLSNEFEKRSQKNEISNENVTVNDVNYSR